MSTAELPGSLSEVSPGSLVPHVGRAPRSIRERLMHDSPAFDFFQAVCLLEKCAPHQKPIGLDSLPSAEAIRFRVQPTNSFSASSIYEIEPPETEQDQAVMTVTFFGMTGVNGPLPRHYTEQLLRSLREGKGPEKRAMLEWLDLFHHRLISLFHRSWAKYRFPIAYARREYELAEPDTFTQAMYSLIGMGMPTLRRRLTVRQQPEPLELLPLERRVAEKFTTAQDSLTQLLHRDMASEATADSSTVLDEIPDLALLRYAGLLTQRPRNVANLQRLISDFFRLPVQVLQFQGQWLALELRNQTQLGRSGCGATLGQDAVIGERVWSVDSKVRLQLGPLSYEQFVDLLPDPSARPGRKAFFLLEHLVRLYLGPELDFDVQLVLNASDVPAAQLTAEPENGPRLGWNCWLQGEAALQNAEDAVFASTPG